MNNKHSELEIFQFQKRIK